VDESGQSRVALCWRGRGRPTQPAFRPCPSTHVVLSVAMEVPPSRFPLTTCSSPTLFFHWCDVLCRSPWYYPSGLQVALRFHHPDHHWRFSLCLGDIKTIPCFSSFHLFFFFSLVLFSDHLRRRYLPHSIPVNTHSHPPLPPFPFLPPTYIYHVRYSKG